MSSLCLSPPGGMHADFKPKVLWLLQREAESGLTYLLPVCVTKLSSWCAVVVVVIWPVRGTGNVIESIRVWLRSLHLGHLHTLFSPSSCRRFTPQVMLSIGTAMLS